MATATDLLADPELLDSEWDLTPLVDGDQEAGVQRQLAAAKERAVRFAQAHAGRVAELDADGLRSAMRELAEVSELIGKAANYASLRFSTDTADAARGAQLQLVQERAIEIETLLLFFDLEWAALADDRAEALLTAPEMDFCAHHLRSARRYRPHLLSEPEEKILAEKSVTSSAAWSRLFSEQTSALRVPLEGEHVSLELAMSRLLSADREQRRTAAEAVTVALEPGLRARAFIYNTLVYEKSVDDRLRSFPHWLAARNLDNQASDESVMALISAVRARYDIPQRWYRLKAQLLGLPQLADYDRSAPLESEDTVFSYGEARDLVLDTYSDFSSEAGALARRFFDEHWIDAPVRPNKRSGAFCAYTVPSVHPYVMLNFTARRRDVQTMAHELGHGLHAALARPQGVFHQSTPLTLAETASVFGETLVFGRLLDRASSDSERLGLLAERLDGMVATVFRQMASCRSTGLPTRGPTARRSCSATPCR
jgi:oligoendopeptidase F